MMNNRMMDALENIAHRRVPEVSICGRRFRLALKGNH